MLPDTKDNVSLVQLLHSIPACQSVSNRAGWYHGGAHLKSPNRLLMGRGLLTEEPLFLLNGSQCVLLVHQCSQRFWETFPPSLFTSTVYIKMLRDRPKQVYSGFVDTVKHRTDD